MSKSKVQTGRGHRSPLSPIAGSSQTSLMCAVAIAVVSLLVVSSEGNPRVIADVDGDGKDDLVGFGDSDVIVSLSDGSKFVTPQVWLSHFFSNNNGFEDVYHLRTTGDVNGDGMADLVAFGYSNVQVALSNGSSFDAPTVWSNDYGINDGWDVNLDVRELHDMDDDGIDDIVGCKDGNIVCSYSDGQSFGAEVILKTGLYFPDRITMSEFPTFGDWNGDGEIDLFYLRSGSAAVYEGPNFVSEGSFPFGRGWSEATSPRRIGDVDGDGKEDIVGFGSSGTYVSLALGDHALSRWIDKFGYIAGEWRVDYHVRAVGDVDGDRKSDIIGFGTDNVDVSLSTGSGFSAPVTWHSNNFCSGQRWKSPLRRPYHLTKAMQARRILDQYNEADSEPSSRTVRVIYFSPKDKAPANDHVGRITRMMNDFKSFTDNEMKLNGLIGRPLRLEKNGNNLVIHHVEGIFPLWKDPEGTTDDEKFHYHYENGHKILLECQAVLTDINFNRESVLILCNLSRPEPGGLIVNGSSPFYGYGGANSGVAYAYDNLLLDPVNLSETTPEVLVDGKTRTIGNYNSGLLGGTIHELMHGLGLHHNKEYGEEVPTGISLLGAGNATYKQELRGEGAPSFLTFIDSMRLASHPIFSGSSKGIDIVPTGGFEDLRTTSDGEDGFIINGKVRSDIPVYGVVAYLDPSPVGLNKDYDSTTIVAVPDETGGFTLACPASSLDNTKDGQLRLVTLFANGKTAEEKFPYTFSAQGAPDTSSIEVAPLAPESLSLTLTPAEEIAVSWAALPNATGYKIYRSTIDDYNTATQIAGDHSLPYYADDSVSPGVRYYYWVTPYNDVGDGGTSPSGSMIWLQSPNLTVSSGADGVQLSWGGIVGATGYEIWRGADPGSMEMLIETSSQSFWDNIGGALPGGAYFYSIVAVNFDVDGSSIASAAVEGKWIGKPDLVLQYRRSSLRGDGIYNTYAGQILRKRTKSRRKTNYTLFTQNDSLVGSDYLKTFGRRRNSKFKISYISRTNNQNVTAVITTGRLEREIVAQGSELITISVRPTSRAAKKKATISVPLSTSFLEYPIQQDKAKIIHKKTR